MKQINNILPPKGLPKNNFFLVAQMSSNLFIYVWDHKALKSNQVSATNIVHKGFIMDLSQSRETVIITIIIMIIIIIAVIINFYCLIMDLAERAILLFNKIQALTKFNKMSPVYAFWKLSVTASLKLHYCQTSDQRLKEERRKLHGNNPNWQYSISDVKQGSSRI